MGADVSINGLSITIRPSALQSLDVRVPGDISAAAFWLVAGCCHPDARVKVIGVGTNPSRTGVLDVLNSMGARVAIENVREEGESHWRTWWRKRAVSRPPRSHGDVIPRVIDELPILLSRLLRQRDHDY